MARARSDRFSGGKYSTSTAVLAIVLTCLGLTVGLAAPGAGASTGAAPVRSLLTTFVDFGCANPANRLSRTLLPAAHPSVSSGATCFGRVATQKGRLGPTVTSGPVGLGPTQIRSAYKLAGLSAGGRTVGIVDAYDDPKAESDLAAYRKAYGLPSCTTANGCFRKVNQNGAASPLPANDYGWAEEISLDLDAVSAACPDCHILLVEANTPDTAPLMTAVDTAVRLGASAVSNSYGGAEDSTVTASDVHLNHPGVAITASSGDSGYGVEWPASSPLRHRGRRHDADGREQRPRLDGEGVVRRRQRLLGLRAQAGLADRTPDARGGRSRTSPPTPTPRPGWACTTPTTPAARPRSATP